MIALKNLSLGDEVTVAEPTVSSSYDEAFTGRVVGFKGDLVTVEDQAENAFDVAVGELADIATAHTV